MKVNDHYTNQYIGRFQIKVNNRWNVSMHKQESLTHLYTYEDPGFEIHLQN